MTSQEIATAIDAVRFRRRLLRASCGRLSRELCLGCDQLRHQLDEAEAALRALPAEAEKDDVG